MRTRLEALLLLGEDAGRLEPLLREERPRQRRFLTGLDGLLGPEGTAVVADVSALLDRFYPRGSLLDRQAPARAPTSGEDVGLHWHHEGEHYLGRTPGEAAGREAFVHPRLADELSGGLDAFVRERLLGSPAILDLDEAGRASLNQRLSGLKAVWAALSERLVSVEEKRAALWRKPKLVIKSSWCACLQLFPRELWSAIAQNDDQRAEWVELFDVELPDEPAAVLAVLEANPTLVVDTRHFERAFQDELIEGLGNLDVARRGVLVQGDNTHALGLLQRRFAGKIQCAYLDPPFNTEGSGFAYADRFRRSSWLCFMEERLALVKDLLTADGTLYAHIDHHEKERLRLLLDRHLHFVTEIIWRIGWLSGFKTRAHKFIRNHDTIYHYGRCRKPLFNKKYLPYPEGYVRRDGKPPTGKGIPLEDTWNCSATDRLDSIQIMSFSREKVGRGNMTQKNENLLERMIEASSRAGDWVLDPFSGSGAACATAHKMGRRWVGIEHSQLLDEVTLPRLKRVLFGDRYGISKAYGWSGGGAFEVLHLESYSDTLANIKRPGREAAGHLSYRFERRRLRLRTEVLAEPLACRARGTQGWRAVDVFASMAALMGLTSSRRVRVKGGLVEVGLDPAGTPVLVHWNTKDADGPRLAERLPTLLAELGWEKAKGRAFSNCADPQTSELAALLPGWSAESVGVAFAHLMAPEPDVDSGL